MQKFNSNKFLPKNKMLRIFLVSILIVIVIGCNILPNRQEADALTATPETTQPTLPYIQFTPDPSTMTKFSNETDGYSLSYPMNWQANKTGTNLDFKTPEDKIHGEVVVRSIDSVDASNLPIANSSSIKTVPFTNGAALKEDTLNSSGQTTGRSYHVLTNGRWYRISIYAVSQYAVPDTMPLYLQELDTIYQTLQIFPVAAPPKPASTTNLNAENTIDAFLEGTPMTGLAPFFVQKGEEHNVDPRLIVGLAYAETTLGVGTDSGAQRYPNPSLAGLSKLASQMGVGALLSPISPVEDGLCGNYNAWGKMGGESCINFSSWDEAIDYVTQVVYHYYISKGETSLDTFTDDHTGSWCDANCEEWLTKLKTAYKTMHGDTNTKDLSWNQVLKDAGTTSNDTGTDGGEDLEHPVDEPVALTLSKPKIGDSLDSAENIILHWNKAEAAAEYSVEVWGGQYDDTPTTKCNWQSGISCSLGQLQPGTISWHVKARSASGVETDWSATWTFTVVQSNIASPTPTISSSTSSTTIGTPQLASPVNGAVYSSSTSGNLYLNWYALNNADKYLVEVWGGPHSSPTTLCGWDVQNNLSCNFGSNKYPDQKIYWHVKAKSASGTLSSWSPTWWFTWNQPAPSQ
jgi:hypothetical protein